MDGPYSTNTLCGNTPSWLEDDYASTDKVVIQSIWADNYLSLFIEISPKVVDFLKKFNNLLSNSSDSQTVSLFENPEKYYKFENWIVGGTGKPAAEAFIRDRGEYDPDITGTLAFEIKVREGQIESLQEQESTIAEELKQILSDLVDTLSPLLIPWQELGVAVRCKKIDVLSEALGGIDGDVPEDLGIPREPNEDAYDYYNRVRNQELQKSENLREALQDAIILDVAAKEQCFLLSNILNLSKIKKRIDHGKSNVFGTIDPNSPLDTFSDEQLLQAGVGLRGSRSSVAAEATQTIAEFNANNEQSLLSQKKLPEINLGVKGNRSVMVDGDTFAFVNKLTQSPSKRAFYDMSNSQISTLQPLLRFFKVSGNNTLSSTCGLEKETEIEFDSNASNNIESILKSNIGIRNPGVGVKSFDFSYDSQNIFSIKKSISAKLVIHANSFSELLEERTNSNGDSYRYVDLALKTGGTETFNLNRQLSDVQLSNLEKLNFRLKVVLGWQNPMFAGDIFSGKSTDVLSAVNNSAVTLNLTPTVHSFSIDDAGRVLFTINFLAYSEDYFDNRYFDIFANTSIILKRIIRDLSFKKLNKDCNAERANDLRQSEALSNEIENEKNTVMRTLLLSLVKKKKLYFLKIPTNNLYYYSPGGPFTLASSLYPTVESLEVNIKSSYDSRDSLFSTAREVADISVEDAGVQLSQVSVIEPTNEIVFFYAGDLIDNILEDIGGSIEKVLEELSDKINNIENIDNIYLEDIVSETKKYQRFSENFKKLRVLLGPIELTQSNSYSSSVVNLGDIPISLKNFMEWLTTKMLKKEKAHYSLTNFLNDFFNVYIRDFLNNDSCYGSRAKQPVHLFENVFTEYRESEFEEDTITRLCKERQVKRLDLRDSYQIPILEIMGVRDDPRSSRGICQEINYLTYYAGRTIPTDVLVGCREVTSGPDGVGCYKNENGNSVKVSDTSDHDKGIWHYQIGKDRGIVKKIDLSKTDSTGLAELRFEQEGYDGLRQLRVLYDANISTYLDVGAFPGSYIYIEPRGFDPSDNFGDLSLTELGIGGYCMIVKSQHTIQPGLAETNLTAKWVASKEPDADQGPNNQQKPKKCSSSNIEN